MFMAKRQEYKKRNETLIMTAQKQAIRINAIKGKINKTQAESKYGAVDETVRHSM